MTRSSIDGAPDYARLAELNRPTDAAALAAEVRRLAGTGLTAGDIATALRLSLSAVRGILLPTPAEAAELHAQRWSART